MSWKNEVERIERQRQLALELGGTEAIAKQHARGRLTIRERVAKVTDAGSFDEVGGLAGHAEIDDEGNLISFSPGNFVLGTGLVGGRPCVIGGEDFTQRGGSPTPAGLRKSIYSEDLALELKLPLVRFIEGGGGSVAGTGAKKGGARLGDPVFARHRFVSIAQVLREVPVVSAGVGAVAGLPAARLAASHLSIITEKTAQVLVAGPALVERALGEKMTKEELGGAEVHRRSGVVDRIAIDEDDAIACIKAFLSYLPRNRHEHPERIESADDPMRTDEKLLALVPRNRRRVYVMRKLIASIVDQNSFFEMTRDFGPSLITGLARFDGAPVGLIANDPHFVGGSMTAAAAQKMKRFLELCETFHLPIVSLVDEPGFMIGSEAERQATIRHGVEAIRATVETTVPWVSVIVRKAYGVAAAAHFGPNATIYAWPSAERGALPLEGGVAVAFRREIAAAPDPDARRQELEEMLAKGRSAFPGAEGFSVHDLIDPRQTRPVLCRWLALRR
ncbi:MAG: carboxyl transferase domain-containing protein [Deltaproteobacteria bacterium]